MGSGDVRTAGQHLPLAGIPDRQLTAQMPVFEALCLLDVLFKDGHPKMPIGLLCRGRLPQVQHLLGICWALAEVLVSIIRCSQE